MRLLCIATLMASSFLASCTVTTGVGYRWTGALPLQPVGISENFGEHFRGWVTIRKQGADTEVDFYGRSVIVKDLREVGGSFSLNEATVLFENGGSLHVNHERFEFKSPGSDALTTIEMSKFHPPELKTAVIAVYPAAVVQDWIFVPNPK